MTVLDEPRIDLYLTKLAVHGGDPERCSEALLALANDGGFDGNVPTATELRELRSSYDQRYRDLERDYGRELENALIAEARENAALANKGIKLAIEQSIKSLQDGGERYPHQVALNLSKVFGASVHEVLRLGGRPTDYSAVADMSVAIEKLVALGILQPKEGITLDGEAVELPDGAASE